MVTLISPTNLSNGKFLGRAGHTTIMVTFTMFENLFQDWDTVMKKSITFLKTIYCLVKFIIVPEDKKTTTVLHHGDICQQNGLLDGLMQIGILMKTRKWNSMSPGRRQAIIWTNATILLVGLLPTHFSECFIEIQTLSLKKIILRMLSVKCCRFRLGLNI